ncbi:hypothetical protein PIB30_075403 [Stylosanthes scabra]|uniref:Uncharacterized protein n=1 Tax=Stylosanthes scabra TaxID=79078 RepID=A0ABU6ZNP7_9FABA|nr:hypothetical protein [Stylosanthes scabra]
MLNDTKEGSYGELRGVARGCCSICGLQRRGANRVHAFEYVSPLGNAFHSWRRHPTQRLPLRGASRFRISAMEGAKRKGTSQSARVRTWHADVDSQYHVSKESMST